MDITQFLTVSLAIIQTVTSVKVKTTNDTSNGSLVYEVPLLLNESLGETRQVSLLSVIDLSVNITNKPPVAKSRDSSVIVTTKPLIATTTELPLTTTKELSVTTEPKFTKNIEPSVPASVITNTSLFTSITELQVNDTTELPMTVNMEFSKTTTPSVRTTKDSLESLVTTNTKSKVTRITELPLINTTELPLIVNTEQELNKTTDSSETVTNNSSVTTNTQSSVATTTELPVTTTEELPFWVRQLGIERQQSTDSSNATSKLSETTATEFNPCLQEGPKMPDFRAPGLRISEIKCKEYIWNVEERQILSQQSFECKEYRAITSEFGLYAIAGGRDALDAEFPHMAAIGWRSTANRWIFKCGSALISSKFVLTAAHCTKVSSRDSTVTDPLPKMVRMGVTDIASASHFPPNDHRITRIIIHPQYKAPKQYYDIALMELDSEILFNHELHPACLWTNFDTSKLGEKASVTGWGVLKSVPIPDTASPVLQVGEVDIIDSQTCDDLLRPHCNRKQCGIHDHQICAGILAGGVDACQGDSGGPLQVMIPLQNNLYEEKLYYVIGVTSYGIGCALENSPGVYTRVSSFIDWIEEIVWPQ